MGISGRIAALFQQNALTPLLALVLMLLGVFATLVTPKEEEPQIDVTMADVMVAFPGASAKDVESLVARPAERAGSRVHRVSATTGTSSMPFGLTTGGITPSWGDSQSWLLWMVS